MEKRISNDRLCLTSKSKKEIIIFFVILFRFPNVVSFSKQPQCLANNEMKYYIKSKNVRKFILGLKVRYKYPKFINVYNCNHSCS